MRSVCNFVAYLPISFRSVMIFSLLASSVSKSSFVLDTFFFFLKIA